MKYGLFNSNSSIIPLQTFEADTLRPGPEGAVYLYVDEKDVTGKPKPNVIQPNVILSGKEKVVAAFWLASGQYVAAIDIVPERK